MLTTQTHKTLPTLATPTAKPADPRSADPLHGRAPELLQARVLEQRAKQAAIKSASAATGEQHPINERT